MLQMWMNIIGYVHSLRHFWTLLKIKRNLLKIQVINNEEIYYSFCLVGMSGGLVLLKTMFQKYGCQTKVMELIKSSTLCGLF